MARDSSVGIATRYGLDGPGIESRWGGGARLSAPVQTGPEAHPASCTMGTGSFPGEKRPGRGADHPPPSKCRGQERVGLYLCSPSGPAWPLMGSPLPTFTNVMEMKWVFDKVRTKCSYIVSLNTILPCVKWTERTYFLQKFFEITVHSTSESVMQPVFSRHSQACILDWITEYYLDAF